MRRASETPREAALEEALTPSAETKAAYIGEFSFGVTDIDQFDQERTRKVTVPWTTTKEIMKAIRDRALSASSNTSQDKEAGG